ncbi:hypothetical protein [Solimonas sp. SE-A11]|uniref:hypothetical protein n=1 Tax=Solimonas sp. SE-A11 TaxID=3054954 RepID=UPI00259C8F7E|nr:hypothetical protein [Solimonas sp. SE-A11]MDM4772405.1 hypothetical protein [Solimonas sp. SE-A11]
MTPVDQQQPAQVSSTPATTTEEGMPRPQATVLTEIGRQHHLFHDLGGDPYAALPAGDGRLAVSITSAAYRELLGRDYYKLTKRGANRNAVTDAVTTLAATAKFDGPQEPVFLRVGEVSQGIVIDLGDQSHRAVVVTRDGWQVVSQAPVHFRRSGKPSALPVPVAPNVASLWRVLNVAEPDRPLVLAWLLAALRPKGPYPILLLVGEQGSAKSTAARILKSLVDPSAVPLRGAVKDERDLLVAAQSSWVVALDNLSKVDPDLSDALCRLANGGGMSSRKLYTDNDENLIELQRPLILNGIDELAGRPDLAERCIQIELPVIPAHERRTEAAVMEEFRASGPSIFAALLDGLAHAIRDKETIKPHNLPRMADFAVWASAGMPALGYSADTFMDAYMTKNARAIEDGLGTSALARAIRRFIGSRGYWEGSTLELLRLLEGQAGVDERSLPGWPQSPKGLTNALRRLGPSLRHVGITFDYGRTSQQRLIWLRQEAPAPCMMAGQASQASQASSVTPQATPDDAMTLVTDARTHCTSSSTHVP